VDVRSFLAVLLLALPIAVQGQTFPSDDPVIRSIWVEAMDSTQLPRLAHELLDVVGPRLTGTPQMAKAHQWAASQFAAWGIEGKTEQYGTWRGWERGTSHIDLLEPRVRTLEGTMLSWCPATPQGGVSARLIIFADAQDSLAFQKWLPSVKGKFVLLSMPQPTGRPDKTWEEQATKDSFDSLKASRERTRKNWEHRRKVTGFGPDTLHQVLEQAGAAGIITSDWSSGWGVYRIFGTSTRKIPAVALSLEDYALLYRLVEYGNNPLLRIETDSRFLGQVPASNSLGIIKGAEKPEEYVVLSAHLDSWDGASGATDNGTGSLIMIEAMRVLKKFYPHPKRTIMAGLWGSEEQGLNGSAAFVADHPEIVDRMQALFNQDNGTGRITGIGAAGFLNGGEQIARWLSRIPSEVTKDLKPSFPGMPGGGGTDNASFTTAGAPGFGVGGVNWDYFAYTWHTNRDTYDKLVFDDLKNNVVLMACLAYLASEDPQTVSRERRVLPVDKTTGKQIEWPKRLEPNRTGKTGGKQAQ
jgi:carboxypeptidase Q